MEKLLRLYIDGAKAGKCVYTVSDRPVFRWCVTTDNNDTEHVCRVKVYDFMGNVYMDAETDIGQRCITYTGDKLPMAVMLYVELSIYGNRYVYPFINACTSKSDWIKACKITADIDAEGKPVYFEKNINTDKYVEYVSAVYAGIGYSRVYINGAELDKDSVLSPNHSDYTKTIYYKAAMTDTLKTKNICLRAVVAEGWRRNSNDFLKTMFKDRGIPYFGRPFLSAFFILHYADGSFDTVYTDESWKWSYGPITYSNIFNGEIYDAGTCTCFDNSVAIISDTDKDAALGEMLPDVLNSVMSKEVYTAKDIYMLKDKYIVDFGQNISGYIRLKLPDPLKSGDSVIIRYAEFLDEDGSLYTLPLRGAHATDTYISGDKNRLKTFTTLFTYHGFRYCEVSGYKDVLTKCDIQAVAVYNDIYKENNYFCCGDPRVNKLHENCVNTEKANILGVLTDCPQRDERMGWMNDATVRFEETPYNFNVGRIFPKIIRDILDEQINGQITDTAPFIYGARPADPVCSSFLVSGYQTMLHTFEKDFLTEAYKGYAAWEDTLLAASKDGIVQYTYYGDWAGPEYACVNSEYACSAVTPGQLMSTGYSYLNCRLLSDMAHVLGYNEDKEKYACLADSIGKAFVKEYLNTETGIVSTGSQACQSFALWLGLIPESLQQKAADIIADDLIKNNYRFTTGNLCTRYMLDMLTKYGHVDEAWSLLTKQDYPSYGFMIENEATTVWERFELKKNPQMNSHDHPMYASCDYWIWAYLIGIKPLEEGFTSFNVRPYFPEGLLSAHGVLETVSGDISVKWTKRYGKTQLFVTVPAGTKANIYAGDKVMNVGPGYYQYEF